MPAETHQLSDHAGTEAVLDFLLDTVGASDPGVELAALDLDDDLSVLHLWRCAAEEFGERSLGDLDLDDGRPRTLAELADLFEAELHR